MCSRGVGAQKLSKSELWWHGPRFLKATESEWPRNKIEWESEVSSEVKTTYILSQPPCPDNVCSNDISWKLEPMNWSSWKWLTHILAWVIRFVCNSQMHGGDRQVGLALMPEEVEEVQWCLIWDAQRKEFREKETSKKESTIETNAEGWWRRNSKMWQSPGLCGISTLWCPIILLRRCWVTKLIVKHYHEIGRDITGTNHTLGNLSTKYWIVAAWEEIGRWENKCNKCKRRRAKAARQVMAP